MFISLILLCLFQSSYSYMVFQTTQSINIYFMQIQRISGVTKSRCQHRVYTEGDKYDLTVYPKSWWNGIHEWTQQKGFHGSAEWWHEMSPEVRSSWKYVWNSSSTCVGTSAIGLKRLWVHDVIYYYVVYFLKESMNGIWESLHPNPGSVTPRIICDPRISYLTLKHQFPAFCKAK